MKKFFNKVLVFLQTLFTSLDTWIHVHVQPSIDTLQRIKAVVDSPLMDAITAIIPGELDDKIKQWVSINLGKAISALNATADIEAQPTLELKIEKLIEYIRSLSPSMRKGIYMRLASEMALASNNGVDKVKGHSVDLLTQLQYSKLAENVSAEDLPAAPCDHTDGDLAAGTGALNEAGNASGEGAPAEQVPAPLPRFH